jgi:hypothetical protein
MKHSPKKLRSFLDFICTKPNLTAAGRSIGVDHLSTIWRWIARSNAGDPEFLVDWPEGDPPQQFAQLILVARKRWIALFEHQLRNECTDGIPRVQTKDGEIIWARDPKLVADAQDPKLWTMLHGDRPIEDTYARDERGALVQLVLLDAAPAHLKIHVSKGLMPALYGDRIDINATVRTPSVMHPGDSKRVKQIVEVPVKQIAHQQVEPVEQTKPEHVAAPEWDRYAVHPDDRPDIVAMKREMRRRLSQPRQLGDPRIVTGPDGKRSIAQVPIGRDNPDDPPERIGGSDMPANAPLPPRRPAPVTRSEDHYGPGGDPAKVPGVTIDGRRTVSIGAKVV